MTLTNTKGGLAHWVEIPLEVIKNLLATIPSITLLADADSSVYHYNNQQYQVVTRRFTSEQFNAHDFEIEFRDKTIALHSMALIRGSKTAGEIYHVLDPITYEMEPEIAEFDEPAQYMIRYAIILSPT